MTSKSIKSGLLAIALLATIAVVTPRADVGAPNHHTYEVQASDRGEPGRGRDTFAITIREPGGAVVASVDGTLSGGNIQSTKARK